MRLETSFIPSGSLIVVRALVVRRGESLPGRFVLDTGAARTTIAPRLLKRLPIGHDDLDGLIGMNFLNALHYDIRFPERRILVELPGR